MIKKALVLFILFAGALTVYYSTRTTTAKDDGLQKVEFIRVIDGDTIEVKYTTAIRIKDLDCFESKPNARSKWQAGEYQKTQDKVIKQGKQSAKELKKLLRGNEKNLYVDVKGMDRFKRILGDVYVGDQNIKQYMLTKGGCMPYKPMPRKRNYRHQPRGQRNLPLRRRTAIEIINDLERQHNEQ